MNLKEYVEWKLTHSDKTAIAEGYPLILEKCKKNKKMKDLKVYGNSVQDGTPTPENPVEVQSVGEKTKNLYNHSTAKAVTQWNISSVNAKFGAGTIASVINTDGTAGLLLVKVGNAADYRGKSLVCTWKPATNTVSTKYTCICIYDANNNGVKESAVKELDNGYFYNVLSIPNTIADTDNLIFRLYMGKGQKGDNIEIKDLMICEGTEPLPYEPYGKYKIPIVQRGKNLYDAKMYPMTDEWCVSNEDGKLYTSIKQCATESYIPCVDIRGYTITISHTTGNATGIAFYDETQKYISGVGNYNKGDKITATVPDEASYYRFSMSKDFMDVAQIEVGESVTDYEPYVEPTTHTILLDEPLDNGEVLDVKEHIPLPMLTSKTTVFTVDSEVEPSNMYGKYIK